MRKIVETLALVLVLGASIVTGACAGRVPLREVQWVPFRATGTVLAKAWVPAHSEARSEGERVVVESVPERWWLMVVTHYGPIRLLVGPVTYALTEQWQHLIVVGTVSDEPHPRLNVDHIESPKGGRTPRDPDNNADKRVGCG